MVPCVILRISKGPCVTTHCRTAHSFFLVEASCDCMSTRAVNDLAPDSQSRSCPLARADCSSRMDARCGMESLRRSCLRYSFAEPRVGIIGADGRGRDSMEVNMAWSGKSFSLDKGSSVQDLHVSVPIRMLGAQSSRYTKPVRGCSKGTLELYCIPDCADCILHQGYVFAHF
jgi:hypothetical protein